MTWMNGACGSRVCSSADEMTFFRAGAVSNTSDPGFHSQQYKYLTPCQLQSGSQLTQSPDSNTHKYILLHI